MKEPGEPQVTDGEVEDGPHGRSAVVGVGGDLHRAHGVFFYSGGLFSGQVEYSFRGGRLGGQL